MARCGLAPPPCVLASLALLTGLLVAAGLVAGLCLRSFFETTPAWLTSDPGGHGCGSPASIVTIEALRPRQNTSGNASQPKEAAHRHLQRRHAVALYWFTREQLLPRGGGGEEGGGGDEEEQRRRRSSSLSEAVQILRLSQPTCVNTTCRTAAVLPNVSHTLVRFGSFALGTGTGSRSRGATCLHVRSCLGADVTHYSAWGRSRQVLLPPYELFRATEARAASPDCGAAYWLSSDLECVYDPSSHALLPVSAPSADALWPAVMLGGVLLVFLLLGFLAARMLRRRRRSGAI